MPRKPRRAGRQSPKGKRSRPAELPARNLDGFYEYQALDPQNDFTQANGAETGPEKPRHYPVLYREILEYAGQTALAGPGGVFVDGTLGEAGHSQLILESFGQAEVIGVDQDRIMLARAASNLGENLFSGRIRLFKANFAAIPSILKADNIRPEVVLLDVGVSRFHFDGAGRGFSVVEDVPLDMRMSQDGELTAADIINTWSEEQLFVLFRQYGEERFSGRIARHIIENRPIQRADMLAEVIKKAVPARFHGRIHPATRVFQALRIYVNGELEVLADAVQNIPPLLAPQGLLMVISFHSLEDRIVKHAFREWAGQEGYTLPVKKPIIPTEQEISENKKSRSAKLRVLKKEKAE